MEGGCEVELDLGADHAMDHLAGSEGRDDPDTASTLAADDGGGLLVGDHVLGSGGASLLAAGCRIGLLGLGLVGRPAGSDCVGADHAVAAHELGLLVGGDGRVIQEGPELLAGPVSLPRAAAGHVVVADLGGGDEPVLPRILEHGVVVHDGHAEFEAHEPAVGAACREAGGGFLGANDLEVGPEDGVEVFVEFDVRHDNLSVVGKQL